MLSNHFADRFPIGGRRLTLTSMGIDVAEGRAQFLFGAGFLLFAQKSQSIADHFACIAVLAGTHLAGDKLFPGGRQ